MKVLTQLESKCVSALATSSRNARSAGIAGRYGRFDVMASSASATESFVHKGLKRGIMGEIAQDPAHALMSSSACTRSTDLSRRTTSRLFWRPMHINLLASQVKPESFGPIPASKIRVSVMIRFPSKRTKYAESTCESASCGVIASGRCVLRCEKR